MMINPKQESRAWLVRVRSRIAMAAGLGVLTAMSLASADSLRIAERPEEVGFNAALLDEAAQLFRDAVEADELRGVVLLVARQGKVVLHEAIGWSDRENEIPIKKDTLFRLASNTKPVVATAALILAEEGKLSLEDPVAKYIPAFDEGDLAAITIRQLMSNSSGLPRSPIFLRGLAEDSNLVREAERFAAALVLQSPPGTEYGYSNPGFNILGGVIEAVSGQRLDHFLSERIYLPLGMVDSGHHESTADPSRMAKVYAFRDGQWTTRWAPGDPASYPIIRASGGMIGTAWDYAIFLQTWLNAGVLGEARLLGEESIALGRTVQSPTGRYGFGWSIEEDGSFGHGGSDGTYAWADPQREILAIVFTQSPGGNSPREKFRGMVNAALKTTDD